MSAEICRHRAGSISKMFDRAGYLGRCGESCLGTAVETHMPLRLWHQDTTQRARSVVPSHLLQWDEAPTENM